MTSVNEIQPKKILIVEDQFLAANHLRLILEKKGYSVIGSARSVAQALEIIERDKPDIAFLDIFLEGKATGIDLASKLQEKHIGYIYLSANSNQQVLDLAKQTQPYGFIVKPFKDEDIITTLEIALYRHQYSIESRILQLERIAEKTHAIMSQGCSMQEALTAFGKALQPYIPFYLMEWKELPDRPFTGLIREKLDQYKVIDSDKLAHIARALVDCSGDPGCEGPLPQENHIYNEARFWDFCKEAPHQRLIAQTFAVRSFVTKYMSGSGGMLTFYSRLPDTYKPEHLALLEALGPVLGLFSAFLAGSGTSGALQSPPCPEVAQAPESLVDFIGSSPKMLTVYDYVRKVARTETSVLILGESGTGKEKIASLIHELSLRRDMPLVTINCGAIPDNLAESILFGHEKGSFTGAFEKRTGKFEQAEGGTIFLDEIAEMPMALQVKLLRVLQEREIEPVGGKAPLRVNVRVVAATNKNLEKEIADGRFRLDLYYRLHVFPIELPPLRQRREDIPALAQFFLRSYCEKFEVKVPSLSKAAMDTLMAYEWPGNIRELEHVIQRAILLNESGQITEINLGSAPKSDAPPSEFEYQVKSFTDNERDFIISMLRRCNGKLSGEGGAAELLGIPTSTLTSKMKKLGITTASKY